MSHDSKRSAFNPSDWRAALASWAQEHKPPADIPSHPGIMPPKSPEPSGSGSQPAQVDRIPLGWWEAAFANRPTPSEQRGHACGEHQMLTVVAYDITDPRRLKRIAEICEDYGMRVQYSVFECRLEADKFDRFWDDLLAVIDSTTDRLVGYKVCVACARDIRSAGTQTHQEKVVAYVF
jgi:CRISPR-associated protein Cas2